MERDFASILLVSRTEVMIERDSWGIRISLSEVKLLDLRKTNYCESICQECFHLSRTKVRGSKTIRYRPSSNHADHRYESVIG